MTADDGSGAIFERSAKWLAIVGRGGRVVMTHRSPLVRLLDRQLPKAFRDQYPRAHTRAGLLLQVQEMIAGEGRLAACA